MDLNQKPHVATGHETMIESLCLPPTHWDMRAHLSLSQTHPVCGILFHHATAVQQCRSTVPAPGQKIATVKSQKIKSIPHSKRKAQRHIQVMRADPEIMKHPSYTAQTQRPTPSGLVQLKKRLEDGTLFQLEQDEMCRCIAKAFHKEMRYLKHAYATFYPAGLKPNSNTPSRVLFDEGFPEIDRTLNGILALRWIVLDEYESFTNNQSHDKLTRGSFDQLRRFFRHHLNDFNNPEALFALIVMQMTNDLGKSTKLLDDLTAIMEDDSTTDMNHDAVMDTVVDFAEDLIPSLVSLKAPWKTMVKKLIKLSAQYNPAQLIQGECQSIALHALLDTSYSKDEINMKFMELFLDLAGAAGHVNHEGAKTMTEPTYQGMMKARHVSIKVVQGRLSTGEAYDALLDFRFDLLSPDFLQQYMNGLRREEYYAIARLLSMGRVVEVNTAKLYIDVFSSLDEKTQRRLIENLALPQATVFPTYTTDGDDLLGGIQPTYFPSLVALVAGSHEEKATMLTALFTFLADVLQVKVDQELRDLSSTNGICVEDILIAERDVRQLAEMVKAGDTSFLYNNECMPRVQIARMRSEL